MATERHGLAQRRHEGFTIWTGAQVSANLLANVGGEFIIDIGGQLAKDAQTSAFFMSLSFPSR
jgi:hypothetical protein